MKRNIFNIDTSFRHANYSTSFVSDNSTSIKQRTLS